MFTAFAIAALVVVAVLLLLILFEPGLKYEVRAPEHSVDSGEFLCLVGALADAQVHTDSRVDVLTDGSTFYEAELAAIRNAKRSVHLEAYIFRADAIGQRFVDAMTERAAAGVKVRVVLDYVGSFTTKRAFFDGLTAAGGAVCWYQPPGFSTLKRLNNRTHRELLVVDGEVGFIGGAGVGDNWLTGERGEPAWRDTVCRVTGDLVLGLQTTFAENWLEAADEILAGDDSFPNCLRDTTQDPALHEQECAGLVVVSTPSAARATRARVLFQTLLASARTAIHVNSPYFLPDRSVIRELGCAVRRGVSVKVITPGKHADHLLTRVASRRRYGQLMEAGVELYEYGPSMIHVKALIVDGVWAVVGSTNFDNRSFGLNDEVNLAAQSRAVAGRLEQDFERDLSRSRRVTMEEWRRRPLTEKAMEPFGRLIERQQ